MIDGRAVPSCVMMWRNEKKSSMIGQKRKNQWAFKFIEGDGGVIKR